MKEIKYIDWALIDYKEAWDKQEVLFNEGLKLKAAQRNDNSVKIENRLVFCEHPHVYTLGKSGEQNNLLISDEFLAKIDARYYRINRGGDITYHGPGQIVGYPILDLEQFDFQLKEYIETIENVVIACIKEYGLEGHHLEGATGVWLDVDKPGKTRKICAIGVRASRYITMHGFAFNINTDLNYFNYINPCGFVDKGVTSLEKEIGRKVELNEVKEKLKKHFEQYFNAKIV